MDSPGPPGIARSRGRSAARKSRRRSGHSRRPGADGTGFAPLAARVPNRGVPWNNEGAAMQILFFVLIVLAIIALVGLILIIGNVIGVILTLIVAGLIGLLADAIVPGEIPFGFLGAILAGLIGSWLGVAILGSIGPVIFHIPIISALIGAIIVALVYSLLTRQLSGHVR